MRGDYPPRRLADPLAALAHAQGVYDAMKDDPHFPRNSAQRELQRRVHEAEPSRKGKAS